MLVAWVCVMGSEGVPTEEQSRDPGAERAAAMENLGMVRLYVFAWGRLQRVSEVKT
jgi:hypothetical protein